MANPLFYKLLNDTLTDSELSELNKWLQEKSHQIEFETFLRDQSDTYTALQDIDFEKAYAYLLERIGSKNEEVKPLFSNPYKYVAIALLLIVGAFGVYFLVTKPLPAEDIEPKITLELEDGTLKTLDESTSGTITNAKGQNVVKQKQSTLIYNDSSSSKETLVYNKLSVPYGKKFHLILSDGTKVFLNSGTKLRYPTKFLPNHPRDVFLDGEAYFLVKNDTLHPFTVVTDEMNTRVLGTKFNVSSYNNDDNTETVLVEGSVGVYDATQNFSENNLTTIKPGERASLKSKKVMVDQVNVLKHIAWTEGKLFFVNDPFPSILKELERHFDVEINNEYEALEKESLTGTFETETLEQILRAFQAYAYFEYRIEDRTITITKPE